jgi:Rod binding domain-containing protein
MNFAPTFASPDTPAGPSAHVGHSGPAGHAGHGHHVHGVTLAQHKQLIKNSQKLIAQTFFGQILKQMRESPFKSELFSGGRGGQMWSSMYDQQLSERLARGAGSKLVHSMVRKIEGFETYRRNEKEMAKLKRRPHVSTVG